MRRALQACVGGDSENSVHVDADTKSPRRAAPEKLLASHNASLQGKFAHEIKAQSSAFKAERQLKAYLQPPSPDCGKFVRPPSGDGGYCVSVLPLGLQFTETFFCIADLGVIRKFFDHLRITILCLI